MIADGYCQIIQNCAIYQTVKCSVCNMYYVPEQGKNCPGCRISNQTKKEENIDDSSEPRKKD